MNLYEIDKAITDCVDLETGEILDEEKLAGLQMERQKKIEGCALWYKNLMAEAYALKMEEQAFKARREVAEKKAERLKNYLSKALDGEEVKTTTFAISWRASKYVDVTDPSKLPAEYLVAQEPKIDKAALLKALKAGGQIAGAALGERRNMSIK